MFSLKYHFSLIISMPRSSSISVSIIRAFVLIANLNESMVIVLFI